jgi:5-methylcytosine-specific restriction protein A
MVKPRKERFAIIERKVIEIAEIRKKTIEEALRFYSSPEWIAVRKRVIQEEGRICAECGKIIENDADVTVDHKSPRSKYREKELDRENLRVLCRRCNSSKGAKEFDL